jgi:signal transduction histidine kinase
MEQMKDDFLSMASHELKTPVTTIKAYGQIAESMLEKKGDVQTLEIIKKMSTQVNRLTTLIDDLLDITKMQKGKLIYDETFFDFNDLVKEVIDDMQTTSVTHQIKSDLDSTAEIYTDKNKLSQVIDNLISNAIKYSPKANSIIVSTQLKNDGVVLCVQDFGIGISAHDQKHVFEQFFRVNRDNQSTFPGMGIGLYICSEIITSVSGKIWIKSVVGKGSSFYIWLPFDHRNNIV